jgi:hypothetical protein
MTKLADIERKPTYNANNAVLVTDGSDYEDARESYTGAWNITKNDVVFSIKNVEFKQNHGGKRKNVGTLNVHVLADANLNQAMTKLHKINSHLCRDANGNASNLFLGSQANNQTHKGIEKKIKKRLSPLEGTDYMTEGGGIALKQMGFVFDDAEGLAIHNALGTPAYSPWVPSIQDGKYHDPPDVIKALNATVKAVQKVNKGSLLSNAAVNNMKHAPNNNAILFWAIPDNDVDANILILKYKTELSAGKQHTALTITSKAKARTKIKDALDNSSSCPNNYSLSSYDVNDLNDAGDAYLDWLQKVHRNFESKMDHYTTPKPFFISSNFNAPVQKTSGQINIDPPRLWVY